MMLPNYICGTWVRGGGDGHVLHDPVTGAEVARVSSAGVAFADALAYGRAVGGAALRSLGTTIQREALVMTYSDIFWLMSVGIVIVLPLVAFGRSVRRRSRVAQDTLADASA